MIILDASDNVVTPEWPLKNRVALMILPSSGVQFPDTPMYRVV